MGVKAIVEFIDPSSFTYDNTKLAIANSQLTLASQVSPSELCYFNFNTDSDNDATRGNFPISPSGGASISGGKLLLPTTTAKAALNTSYYSTSTGAIHFKLTLNSFPTVAQTLVDYRDPSGASQAQNYIRVQDGGSGNIQFRWIMRDDSGTTFINAAFGVMAHTPGMEVDVYYEWDLVGGSQRFFLNGVGAYNSPSIATMTNTGAHTFIIGKDRDTSSLDFDVDDFQTFNTAVKAGESSFSVPVPEATPYPTGSHKCIVNPLITLDQVNGFMASSERNTGEIKYYFTINSVPYWHDGVDWVVSDETIAQSNTEPEIQANIETIPVSDGVSLRMSIFLEGSDLYQTPVINSVCMDYDFFLDPVLPVVCAVYGSVRDNGGNAVGGAKVTFQTPDYFYNNSLIATKVEGFTDNDGVFAIAVVETQTIPGIDATCTIEYKEAGKTIKNTYTGLEIPASLTAKISDLI